MVTYHIRLRKFRVDVDVPSSVKGISNVAHYITDEMANKYADTLAETRKVVMYEDVYDKVLRESPTELSRDEIKKRVEEELNKIVEPYRNGLHKSYYDSHIPSITQFLRDLRQKLEERR